MIMLLEFSFFTPLGRVSMGNRTASTRLAVDLAFLRPLTDPLPFAPWRGGSGSSLWPAPYERKFDRLDVLATDRVDFRLDD